MAQYGRPMADTFNSEPYVTQSGSSSTIYTSIDEVSADDDDYIRSPNNPSAEVYVCKLTSVDDPGVSAGHIIRVRMKKDLNNPNTLDVTVQLRQGYVNEGTPGTLIATLTQASVTTSFADYSYELLDVEADAITDYTDLYLRFVANP